MDASADTASQRARNRRGARLFQIPKESEVARTRKLGEVIAYAIKRDIAARGWPVGEVLGNQEELMRRYKVSRSTLREAIRQVERHGVARMRRGVNGGLVIQQPARDSVVLAVASYLELASVSLNELFEAREVVEELMIGLVCERATDADLRELQKLLDHLLATPADDVARDVQLQLALRSDIAALSRNGALLLLLEALYRVTSDMLTVAPGHPRIKHLLAEARREKRELVDAIVSGNEVAARMALRTAAQRARDQAEQQLKRLRRKSDGGSALTLSVQRLADDSGGALPKLGHRVSLRIAHDIALAGMAPGSRIGSEPELCSRYGVSRAVFREAVRTLELHDIVQVRRGLGGGLVASAPSPDYTVELTSIYFQYARLKPRHFYELWRVIQTSAAQSAARRIDAAGRAMLDDILEQQRKAPREAVLEVHGRFHDTLSTLSGNAVIGLFTKVMAEIAAHYSTEVPTPDVWKVFIDSHAELAAAISAGEAALARRLMARHLKLVDAWYGQALRRSWLQTLSHGEEEGEGSTARKAEKADAPAARKQVKKIVKKAGSRKIVSKPAAGSKPLKRSKAKGSA